TLHARVRAGWAPGLPRLVSGDARVSPLALRDRPRHRRGLPGEGPRGARPHRALTPPARLPGRRPLQRRRLDRRRALLLTRYAARVPVSVPSGDGSRLPRRARGTRRLQLGRGDVPASSRDIRGDRRLRRPCARRRAQSGTSATAANEPLDLLRAPRDAYASDPLGVAG